MSIYLIRHADKKDGDYYSPGLPLNDQPIDDAGIGKSKRLVHLFEGLNIEGIFVSEYIRTFQTISYLANSIGISPKIDKRLNEIDIGDTDKLSDEEIQKQYPDFWKKYWLRNEDFSFPNGESGEEAGNRIWEIINELDHEKNYILTCHDGIIRLALCKMLNLPVYMRHQFIIDYCSVTEAQYLEHFKIWSLKYVNRCCL